MSRDPRDPQGAEDADGAVEQRRPIDPERRAELVTAYVDGVAELSPDERRGVEALLARDPEARAEADAVHALLDRLRALPPEGRAPDWAAMERSIRQAVAAAPARPWWRRWQWLVPAVTCATAAAVLLGIWPRAASIAIPPHLQRPPNVVPAVPVAPAAKEPPAEDSVVALWLDGTEVDLDVSAPAVLGDVGIDLDGAQARQPLPQPSEDGDEIGLLPATDLAWVDTLDDAALDRVERWLANPQDPDGPDGLDRRRDSQSPLGKSPRKRKI